MIEADALRAERNIGGAKIERSAAGSWDYLTELRREYVCEADKVDPGARLARGFATVLVEAAAQALGTAEEMPAEPRSP